MNKEHIPVIPLRGLAVLPDAIIHFDLKREKSIHAVEYAMMGDGLVFLASQKDPECQDPGIRDLYTAGTVASVRQVTKLPNQMLRILVGGVKRAMLTAIQEANEAFLEGSIIPQEELADEELSSVEEEAMLRQLKETIAEFAALHPKLDKNAVQRYQAMEDLGSLLDQITMNLPVEFEKKQQVLEAFNLEERFEAVCTILVNEIQIAGIRNRLAQKLKGKVEKNQKEYLLREQLRYIREELGEENSFSDSEQFEEKLKELKAKPEVKEKIRKEISRFKSLSGNSSESAVERGYIETLLELPWDKASIDNESIKEAGEILEKEHYGLTQVKERILEFLAVRCLTKKGESPILCLVGPPGTGKTSIARSVARALNKRYIRICLGGVRDEAEIRGHRKTYVGAMPGRIATGLRQAGVKNPLDASG